MGTKNNPGKFDCYEKADPDEPIFVLRANDPIAPVLVRKWVAMTKIISEYTVADSESQDEEQKFIEAIACANAMDNWRTKNVP